MKRVISLCCVCLILVMSLSVPARADEISNADFLDVLAFNSHGYSMYTFQAPGGSAVFDFPFTASYRYLDALVLIGGSVPSSARYVASGTSYQLNLVHITDSVYRLFGPIGTATSNFSIEFDVSSTCWLTFKRLEVSAFSTPHLSNDAYCSIVSAEFEGTIHFVPTDEVNHRIFQGTDDFQDTFFISYIWCEDWYKYDYLDLQLLFDVFAITSVSASMGEINIPLDVSIFDPTSIDGNSFLLNMRMDLSGLDRSSSDYPMVTIMGRVNTGALNSIDFVNCSGYFLSGTMDPYLYWFQSIAGSISSGFASVQSWISAQTSSLQIEMQDMVMSISMEFTNLKSTINTFSSNVNSWIRTQTTAIESQFSSLKSSLNSWILNQTNTLESAIRGDTDPGDDFQDQVDQKDQELEDMAAVMDSVTKPAIQDINVSLDQYVKPADVQVLATPLTVFLEADLFRTMIIMSILLATVSFTLYGKR